MEQSEPRILSIGDMADTDRPRERAMNLGIQALSNAELLAILLGSGTRTMPVMELSRHILNRCDGKLSHMARMSIHQLIKEFPGVGPAKAVSLAAAIELGGRCRSESLGNTPVRGPQELYEYIAPKLQHLSTEEFWVMTLNRANMITHSFRLSSGGTDSTVVDIKMLVKTAADRLAASVALAHNHPSGNRTPSPQDDRLTEKIRNALSYFDIRLIDHIIVCGPEYYSYSDSGRL